jgi:predicted GNAT family N-acyltransferase
MNVSICSFCDAEAAIRRVRHEVFIEEQGVPVQEEFDDDDPACVHVVVTDDGQAVGTGRLKPDGRIGRVAVLKSARGSGVGRAIMAALEEHARACGMQRLWAHAQVQALIFYERLGYRVAGETFMEAGIAHREIQKPIPSIDPASREEP